MARGRRRDEPAGQQRHGLIGTLLEPANAIVQSIVQEVAPVVVAAVDVDGVVQQIDIQQIVDRIDIQQIVDKIDIEAIVNRIDIQSVVEGLDLQTIIEHVDIGKVLESVDLNEVLERVDLDRLLDRIDVNKLVVRLDPNVIVVMLNLLLPQLDLNAHARLSLDAAALAHDAQIADAGAHPLAAHVEVDGAVVNRGHHAFETQSAHHDAVADAREVSWRRL